MFRQLYRDPNCFSAKWMVCITPFLSCLRLEVVVKVQLRWYKGSLCEWKPCPVHTLSLSLSLCVQLPKQLWVCVGVCMGWRIKMVLLPLLSACLPFDWAGSLNPLKIDISRQLLLSTYARKCKKLCCCCYTWGNALKENCLTLQEQLLHYQKHLSVFTGNVSIFKPVRWLRKKSLFVTQSFSSSQNCLHISWPLTTQRFATPVGIHYICLLNFAASKPQALRW